MIVGIHQPHFLPWMGYFNKVLHSDVFVWLHAVQFRKNYYQNRTRIKNVNGEPLWLTLPVHAKLGMRIDEVTIADDRWYERIQKTVEQCYRKAPHFAECWTQIAAACAGASTSLDDINFRTFNALLKLLGASSVRVERVEHLHAASEDPTLRLVEICEELGASAYIAGAGGRNYLREEEFEKAGIRLLWQEFDPHRVVHPQLGETFVPGLSIIDCLFNAGPAETRELLVNAWRPEGKTG